MTERNLELETIENSLFNEHKLTLQRYRAQGIQDGRINVPKENSTDSSQSELAIRAIYNGLNKQYNSLGSKVLSEYKSNWESIGSELNYLHQNPETIPNEIAKLTQNYEDLLHQDNETLQQKVNTIYQHPEYINAQSELIQTEQNFKQKASELNRALPVVHKIWYYPVLFLMGISEFYLTYSAFSSNGDTVLGTAIMALSAGIVFPIIAHFSGKILRQEMKNLNKILSLVFLFGIAIGLALFLAKQIVNLGITQSTILTPSEANNTLIMRILIVLGIFTAGVLMSFFNHEKNEMFLDLFNLKEKSKNKFKKIDTESAKRYSVAVNFHAETKAEITKKQKIDLSLIQSKKDNLMSDFRKAEQMLAGTDKKLENKLKEINSWYKITIHEYRTQNLSNRTFASPENWNREPDNLAN